MSEFGRLVVFVVVGGLLIAAVAQMSADNDAFARECRSRNGAVVPVTTIAAGCRLPDGTVISQHAWEQARTTGRGNR